MVKVTKKMNHDSLWVKATTADKSYFKLSVTRRGITTTHTMEKLQAEVYSSIVSSEFQKYQSQKLKYGQLIDNVEQAFNLVK